MIKMKKNNYWVWKYSKITKLDWAFITNFKEINSNWALQIMKIGEIEHLLRPFHTARGVHGWMYAMAATLATLGMRQFTQPRMLHWPRLLLLPSYYITHIYYTSFKGVHRRFHCLGKMQMWWLCPLVGS